MYLTAITGALGIPRSLFSINDTCRYVASAVVNLFFSTLVYRFGVRKMTVFGFLTLMASMTVYACAQTLPMFYLGGLLLGVGLTFTTTTMASSIVRRWFTKDIGRYTGIVFAANGVGAALAAQIAAPLINAEGDPFGYRSSYLVVGGILAVSTLVVGVLLRERPATAAPVEPVAVKKRAVIWHGIEFQTVKKRPWFYMTALMVFLTGYSLQGITGVYAAHMEDVGLDMGFIATVVSAFSLMLTGSKIFVGTLFDRRGLRWVLTICQLAAAVAFLVLAFLNKTSTGMVMAGVFALLYALALPLETLVVPLLVGDLFGTVSYDKILGIMLCMNYAGYALGAPTVNLCYDAFGSYRPALLMVSALMLVAWVISDLVIRAAKKEKGELSATISKGE